MEASFHDRWFRRKHRPIGDISATTAKSRYARGEPFCLALRGAGGSYLGFVEVGSEVFGAGFIDPDGTVRLDYSFIERGGRLFLSQAVVVEGGESTPEVQVTYYFDTSGQVVVETWRVGSPNASRAVGQADVLANWEPVPTFERIPDLLRRERLPLPPPDHIHSDSHG